MYIGVKADVLKSRKYTKKNSLEFMKGMLTSASSSFWFLVFPLISFVIMCRWFLLINIWFFCTYAYLAGLYKGNW